MKSKIIIMVVIVVAVGGGAFYGGMLYGKSSVKTTISSSMRGFQQGAPAGSRASGANAVSGEILSITDKMITVKMREGGSKNVLYTDKTTVRMFVEAPIDTLKVGNNITITGTANADGSLTAQNVQVRSTAPSSTQPAVPFEAPKQ